MDNSDNEHLRGINAIDDSISGVYRLPVLRCKKMVDLGDNGSARGHPRKAINTIQKIIDDGPNASIRFVSFEPLFYVFKIVRGSNRDKDIISLCSHVLGITLLTCTLNSLANGIDGKNPTVSNLRLSLAYKLEHFNGLEHTIIFDWIYQYRSSFTILCDHIRRTCFAQRIEHLRCVCLEIANRFDVGGF